MQEVVWVVQTNVEPESSSPELLRRACSALNLGFQGVSVERGATELPALLSISGPAVFHGRATLLRLAQAQPRLAPGVFFTPARFCHAAYVAAYGKDMLNADAQVMPLGQFTGAGFDANARYFIRPDADSKLFTGEVTTIAALLARAGNAKDVLETPCVVAPIQEIDAEWRLFVVEGRVVSGSMYRPSGERAVPPEVVRFAEHAALRWAPAPVFVMDVARVNRGWKIVECNCFNGSRFYEADVEAVVVAVSRFRATAGVAL